MLHSKAPCKHRYIYSNGHEGFFKTRKFIFFILFSFVGIHRPFSLEKIKKQSKCYQQIQLIICQVILRQLVFNN